MDRMIPHVYCFVILMYYVLVYHKGYLDVFDPQRKPRFVVFFFYMAAYVYIIIYDILATNLKYEEGYADSCLDCYDSPIGTAENTTCFWKSESALECRGVIPASSGSYSEHNKNILPVIDTLWNLSCTFRNSGIFMLLAWFNSTVKGIFPKPVVKRWEVRMFAFYSMFSLAWYLILPELFSVQLLKTIAPQVLWSVELAFAGLFLLLSNHRITKLSTAVSSAKRHSSATSTLSYVKAMNTALCVICLHSSLALLILNVDILSGWFVILRSAYLSDFFTKIVNTGLLFEPIVAILIIYKPKFKGMHHASATKATHGGSSVASKVQSTSQVAPVSAIK